MQPFSWLTRSTAISLARHARRASLNSARRTNRAGGQHSTPIPSLTLVAGATSVVGLVAHCDGNVAMHDPSNPYMTEAMKPLSSRPTGDGSSISFTSHQSQYGSLLEEVSTGDARAIHALALLVNDIHNHSELLEANAVSALRDALQVCEEKQQLPLRLNVVRLLADLSKQHQSHVFFARADVIPVLDRIVAESAAAMKEGWIDWLYRQFSFGPAEQKEIEKDEPKPAESPFLAISPPGDAVVDYLSKDIQQSSTPLDLQNGLSYHITRCVANLARDTETHQSILETSMLQNLCDMLNRFSPETLNNDELVSETLRHTILAVSALCKSAAEPVIYSRTHRTLIAFAQCDDTIAQTYSCGGIRNLTRHEHAQTNEDVARIHRELVVSKVVDALKSGMAAASGQTKVFALLAFGDLMTTPHFKADLIRKRLEPAYQVFAGMLKDKNPAISRAVSRVLVSIFGDESNSSKAPLGLAKLVAENSGQLVNGGVARGDMSALAAVRAMCNDKFVAKEMVDKGLLEVLILGVKKGNSEFLQQCTAALSSLSNWTELSNLIASRGALKAVLLRPSMEDGARYAAAFLANLAREPDMQVEVAHGGLHILLTALASKDENARREGVRGLYNLSLGGVTKVMVTQSNAMVPLIKEISRSSGETRRYAVDTLADMTSSLERATKFIEADVLGVLLKAVKDDETLSCSVARCISQLSQVAEVHGLLAKSGAVEWLLDMISRNGGRGERAGDVLLYSMIAVSNIAYSPGITRSALREHGAVALLKSLSSSGMSSPMVLMGAKQALKNIKGDSPALLPAENISPAPKPA